MRIKILLLCILLFPFQIMSQQALSERETRHDLGSGNYLLKSKAYANYKTVSGTFEPTDLSIVQMAEADVYGNRHAINKAKIQRSFPDSSNGTFFYSVIDNGAYKYAAYKFVRTALLNIVTKDHSLLSAPNTVPVTFSGDTVFYKGIYADVDLYFINLPNQVKQEYRVSESRRATIPGGADEYLCLLYQEVATNLTHSIDGDSSLYEATKKINNRNIRMLSGNKAVIQILNGYAFTSENRFKQYELKTATFTLGGKRYIAQGMPCNIAQDIVTYPGDIIIDPTISDVGGTSGYVTGLNATYATARTTGTSSNTTAFIVGQQDGEYVFRTYEVYSYSSLPIVAYIDSSRIIVDGNASPAVSNAFNILVLTGFNTSVATAAFPQFHGWVTGAGAYTNAHSIINPFPSGSHSTDNNYLIINKPDSILAHISDSLVTVWISSRDSTSVAPTDLEYLNFTKGATLEIYYRLLPYVPYNISSTGSGVGEIRSIFTDSSSMEVYVKLLDANLVVKDSMFKSAGALTDTLHWTGLVPANNYNYYLSVVSTTGDSLVTALQSGTAGTAGTAGGDGTPVHGIVPRVSAGSATGRVQ